MQVGDEYRLQTREGSEWDREFRNRQTKLNSDDGAVQFQRDQLLYSETDKIVRGIKLVQGAAKEPRQFLISRDPTPPTSTAPASPSGFRTAGRHPKSKWWMRRERRRDQPDPLRLHSAPVGRGPAPADRRGGGCAADAGREGQPNGDEGREARQSMESRYAMAVGDRDRLVRDIVANAKVFQGGGSEMIRLTLEDRVRDAPGTPSFGCFRDSRRRIRPPGRRSIKRARDGADQPFQPVGHTDATEKHPVCMQVICSIGAGKVGAEIRKALASGALRLAAGCGRCSADRLAPVAAHHGHSERRGGSTGPTRPEQDCQGRVPCRTRDPLGSGSAAAAEAHHAASAMQERRRRRQSARVPRRAGNLARSAGGDAPLPAPPSTTDIEDIQRLVGNEQLVAIKDKAADLGVRIKDWTAARDLAAKRLPTWAMVERLARHAGDLPGGEAAPGPNRSHP